MRSNVHSDPTRRRFAVLLAVVGGAASTLALAAPAGAAVQVGQTFDPTSACASNTRIQSTSPGGQYTVPSNGVLTSWSRFSDAISETARLKVGRASVGGVVVIGESVLQVSTAVGVNSFATRVPVQAGDFIGIFTGAENCTRSMGGYVQHTGTGDVPVGGSAPNPITGFQMSVSAILEADADNDGFGDESQDQCPTDASTQGACPSIAPPADTTPPDTAITGGPKDKTKKKIVTFEFISSEPGSTFRCGFDDGPLAPCTSPETEDVGKGRHEFDVVAVDAAGNADATPAEAFWKVKRKKKK